MPSPLAYRAPKILGVDPGPYRCAFCRRPYSAISRLFFAPVRVVPELVAALKDVQVCICEICVRSLYDEIPMLPVVVDDPREVDLSMGTVSEGVEL